MTPLAMLLDCLVLLCPSLITTPEQPVLVSGLLLPEKMGICLVRGVFVFVPLHTSPLLRCKVASSRPYVVTLLAAGACSHARACVALSASDVVLEPLAPLGLQVRGKFLPCPRNGGEERAMKRSHGC